MRSRFRYVLAGLAGVAVVIGAILSFSGVRGNQRPIVLSGESVFPDHSAGHSPGPNLAYAVGIRFTLGTNDPWIQGERHELIAEVAASPGSGVTSVDLTTLILYFERPSFPGGDIVGSDLILLDSAGANRWRSMDGPLVIFPNLDVAGESFFLTFAISLDVEYDNGRSYGYGGWDPSVRMDAPDIVPDLAPYGLMLISTGTIGGVVMGFAWASPRPRPPVAR